jgi:hypothetical protein
LVQAATLVSFLVLVRDIIDLLASGLNDASAVRLRIGYMAAVVIVHALARAAEFSVSERMGYEIVRGLRSRMYEHLQGRRGFEPARTARYSSSTSRWRSRKQPARVRPPVTGVLFRFPRAA